MEKKRFLGFNDSAIEVGNFCKTLLQICIRGSVGSFRTFIAT